MIKRLLIRIGAREWCRKFFDFPSLSKFTELERDVIFWHNAYDVTKVAMDRARHKSQWLSRNLVEMRVCQSKLSRTGWEVMCFIPEDVVKLIRLESANSPAFVTGKYEKLVQQVTLELVRLAIEGIVRVDGMGRVNALVFEPLNLSEPPRAPRYVMALFDKDGEFKMSEKCWDQRTQEQRAREAAGCGGYGV